MALTYTNIASHVAYHLGNRSDVSSLISSWVNWAYKDVWNMLPVHNKGVITHHTSVTGSTDLNTVDGTAYVAIPTGIFAVLQVLVNGKRLRKRNWRDYEALASHINEGLPTDYYIFGGNIYLNPTPDAAYAVTVWGVKALTEISSTSTPDIPDDYESALISIATAYGWRALNMPEKASAWFTMGFTALKNAVKQQRWETEDHELGVQMSYDDGDL